jgi:hypothetical protein
MIDFLDKINDTWKAVGALFTAFFAGMVVFGAAEGVFNTPSRVDQISQQLTVMQADQQTHNGTYAHPNIASDMEVLSNRIARIENMVFILYCDFRPEDCAAIPDPNN